MEPPGGLYECEYRERGHMRLDQSLAAVLDSLLDAEWTLERAEELFRQKFIERALERTRFKNGRVNQCQAARAIGFHRNSIARELRKSRKL